MKLFAAWRDVGVFVTVLLGVAAMLVVAHHHYPITAWLVWRYVAYWLVGVGWMAACVGAGHRLLYGLAKATLPALDGVLMSLACGVLFFFAALFVAGLLGWLTPTVAVGLPLAMLAVGGSSPWQRARRIYRRVYAKVRLTRWQLTTAAFGTLALGMIYLTVSTPENIGFDAQWYHLPVAEHFAAGRRIGPFVEGWYLGAYPHLASILYAWAFLLPGTELFDRVLLAAHIEWFLFLATVFAVPLLVRRLVRRAPPSTWAVVFLFPSVFLYDGGLFIGADHVLAFWVIPAYLALLRVERRLDAARVALLAVALAGAILTKYQAMYVLLPVSVRLVWTCIRGASSVSSCLQRLAAGPAFAATLGLVFTSPHWLANYVWYGDPFFPALHGRLDVHPWSGDAARQLSVFQQAALWQPSGDWLDKALATGRAIVTFSFEPHDWPTYHGAIPVFGSTFTVLSFAALLLRRSRALLQLVVSTTSGVALWFVTSHQDRYLQCLLPWMAAATAAVIVQIGRQMPRLRPLLAIFVGAQLAWGADVYFIPAKDNSHENDRPSPIKAAVDLASSGYRGDYEQRLHPFPPWEELGRSLPREAKVLVHERYLRLGLGRMAVTDLPGWQSGIGYESLGTPSAIHAALRDFGVTHVVWESATSHQSDTLAGDVAFWEFISGARVPPQVFGRFSVIALADINVAPVNDAPGPTRNVALYECPLLRQGERSSIGAPADDGTGVFSGARVEPDEQARWLVVDRTCHHGTFPGRRSIFRRGAYEALLAAPAGG